MEKEAMSKNVKKVSKESVKTNFDTFRKFSRRAKNVKNRHPNVSKSVLLDTFRQCSRRAKKSKIDMFFCSEVHLRFVCILLQKHASLQLECCGLRFRTAIQSYQREQGCDLGNCVVEREGRSLFLVNVSLLQKPHLQNRKPPNPENRRKIGKM